MCLPFCGRNVLCMYVRELARYTLILLYSTDKCIYISGLTLLYVVAQPSRPPFEWSVPALLSHSYHQLVWFLYCRLRTCIHAIHIPWLLSLGRLTNNLTNIIHSSTLPCHPASAMTNTPSLRLPYTAVPSSPHAGHAF